MTQFFRWGRIVIPLLISILVISCKKDEDGPSSAKQILSFRVNDVDATIDATAHTITLLAKEGTDLTQAAPVLNISPWAKVKPASEEIVDLSKPVVYTVTAEDNSTQTYTVTATYAPGAGNELLSFTGRPIKGGGLLTGQIDNVNHTVTIKCSFDFNYLQDVEIKVTASAGATVSPGLIDTTDLRVTQYYRIKSLNGDIQEYTIKTLNTDSYFTHADFPALHDFFDGLNRSAVAGHLLGNPLFEEDLVGLSDKNFFLFYATESEDVTSLVIKFTEGAPGATISPDPSVPRDYTHDQTFTVKSQAGNTRDYKVRIVKRKMITTNEGTNYPTGEVLTGNSDFIYYYSSGPLKEALFVNDETKEEIMGTLYGYKHFDWGYQLHSFSFADGALKKGNYTLKVKLSDDTYFLTRLRYVVQ